jgi:hypothetical protein
MSNPNDTSIHQIDEVDEDAADDMNNYFEAAFV